MLMGSELPRKEKVPMERVGNDKENPGMLQTIISHFLPFL